MEDTALDFDKASSSAASQHREARCLAAVKGPGVVALRNVGDDGELVLARAACSLADVLHERGPRPEGEVRAVAAAAAAALARVHEAGLVHGDVKPANLLLSLGGELWLADFDTAAVADGRPLAGYSPRRLPPGAPARPEADIAALAIALVELSTGSLLDPGVPWRAGDLRRLGCSPPLSAEISFLLGGDGSTPSARAAAEMFGRDGASALPEPAVSVRRVDPTPTIDFLPVRPAPPDSPAPSASEAIGRPSPWWRRLAASWRQR